MQDFGYDVSDYYSIHPEYGTMDDFEQLLKKANELSKPLYCCGAVIVKGVGCDGRASSINFRNQKINDWSFNVLVRHYIFYEGYCE